MDFMVLVWIVIKLTIFGGTMKDAIIEPRVNRFTDISLKIKQFVHEKAAQNNSPFKEKDEDPSQYRSLGNKAKRSLTDWRQLYQKNDNKIVPRHTVYPATPDGTWVRCSMTGQCNRRKIHSSAKTSYQPQRSFMTRQTIRTKFNEARRQSMVEFALAQNACHQEVLVNDTTPLKERKIHFAKDIESKRSEYAKVGMYLSKAQKDLPSERSVDVTDTYIKKLYNETVKPKIREFNQVRIKESQKINNERFIQSLRLLRLKRKVGDVQKGLRYYQRA